MKLLKILIATLLLLKAYSQEPFTKINTIPKELKENSDAVIRLDNKEITILSNDKMIVKHKQVITILKPSENKILDTYLYYGDDTKINDISLTIYDVTGNLIEKRSKSKFIDINAADGFSLYNDDRVTYVDYTPNSYPYTAIFEYEYKTASTALIPSWHPINSYNVSVENSKYTVFNPNQLNIKSKEKNFKNYNITKDSNGVISYTMNNQPAIRYESNSDYYFNILPNLLVSLEDFTLRGVKGQATDWNSFGKWMNDNLLKGKIKLSESCVSHAKNLVKDAKNDLEKAKILYEYMQNKTRYISIQIGIGGWQPVFASDVDRLGYGDCKGLTIYMKALLEAVNIPSYYTIVYAGNKRNIDSNFSSIQGNHAILNIPYENDDIWLECTSQTLPFGFLGDFTNDRDVLVITDDGGKIKRTPSYKNQNNSQITTAEITLDTEGNFNAEIERISKGLQYANRYSLSKLNNEDLNEYYKTNTWRYINNLEIDSVELTNNKDDISLTERLNISANEYSIVTGSDYIFSINFFNRNQYIPRRQRNRQMGFVIENGYKDEDVYTIKIPEAYDLGTLPQFIEVKTQFGEFSRTIDKIDKKTVRCKTVCIIYEGKFPKESYSDYRSFRKQIAKEANLKLILKKSNQ